MKSAEIEKSSKKAELNYMTDLITLKRKTLIGPKVLQVKLWLNKVYKERVLDEFFGVWRTIGETRLDLCC